MMSKWRTEHKKSLSPPVRFGIAVAAVLAVAALGMPALVSAVEHENEDGEVETTDWEEMQEHGCDDSWSYTTYDPDTDDDSDELYGRVPSKDIDLNYGCDEGSYRIKYPLGLTGHGEEVYVVDRIYDGAFAFSIDFEWDLGKPVVAYDTPFPDEVSVPRDIFTRDGYSLYVANGKRASHRASLRDDDQQKIYEVTLAASNGTTEDTIEYDSDNKTPGGMWADFETLWVLDMGKGSNNKIYAYKRSTGERDSDKDIGLDDLNGDPRGIWSDWETVWVADEYDKMVYAYDLDTGDRETTKEFDLDDDNADAWGMWSDGDTMWVVDTEDLKLYAYSMTGTRDGGL